MTSCYYFLVGSLIVGGDGNFDKSFARESCFSLFWSTLYFPFLIYSHFFPFSINSQFSLFSINSLFPSLSSLSFFFALMILLPLFEFFLFVFSLNSLPDVCICIYHCMSMCFSCVWVRSSLLEYGNGEVCIHIFGCVYVNFGNYIFCVSFIYYEKWNKMEVGLGGTWV